MHDEARVGGAALFAVFEAFFELFGEQVPLAEFPDAVGVDAFHFEHVAFAGIDEGTGNVAAIAATADEAEAIDVFVAHKCIAKRAAAAADETDGQAVAARDGHADGKGGAAAVGWGFGDAGVAAEDLDEHGVLQDAEGIIPTGDVGDESQRRAVGDHAVDVVDVPRDTFDASVSVGERKMPRLADFPHEQLCQQFAVGAHVVDGGADAGFAFFERNFGPGFAFRSRGANGVEAGGQVDHREFADQRAIDG